MDFLKEFIEVYLFYSKELWWSLALGFLLSGFLYNFLPSNIVEKYLGGKGIKPIFLCACVGVLLPVCCIGALPLALTLKKKGARLGPVLAFLVTTPATSLPALIVCLQLLGLNFTVFIFFVVIIMGLVMGIITDGVAIEQEGQGSTPSCCQKDVLSLEKTKKNKIKDSLRYAFITLPKEIGGEILIGIGVASFITIFSPLKEIIGGYLTGLVGYFAVMTFGLLSYVCSTASVPLADALLKSGLSSGQVMCYLLVGPITSYGTLLVIKKDFGSHVLLIYLSIICFLSLIYGIIFDTFFV